MSSWSEMGLDHANDEDSNQYNLQAGTYSCSELGSLI